MSQLDLSIGGMTCASCAARIEKKLNRLEGVTATVNYATEKAHVQLPDDLSVDEVVRTVEAVGYSASVAQPPPDDSSGLRARLIGSTALALPVLLLSMVPAFQFRHWQWLA